MQMNISTQPYKGARDFYPEEKRLQKWMFTNIRTVCERFGYEEYDAPILESTELYLSKGSDEIINEQTYTFFDRGGRSVTVRTEMTPSVSRMIAGRRQELAYPVRWYSLPNLWRYERPQRGRGREFFQPNVDIFGVEGVEADHEIIAVADQVLKSFGAKPSMYTINVNSRKLVDNLLGGYLGLTDVQATTVIRLVDRMHKMQPAEFQALVENTLNPEQRENGTFDRLMGVMRSATLDQLPEELKKDKSLDDIKKLFELLDLSGITNVRFDISLMRGFDYYTDIVFEVFDTHPENNRAMFGGGRYNGLVSMFGVEPVPAAGFAFGDITLQNFLEVHGLMPTLKNEINLCIVLIGDVYSRAIRIIDTLREEGVNVYVDTSGRKPEKQIKNIIKKGCNYVLFIGENEIAEQVYGFKNLEKNEETKMSLERVISTVLAK